MIYYRYDASGAFLHCHEFQMIKKTPCGAWISVFGVKKFVLDFGRKKYAYPKKEDALESYYARKKKQVEILEHKLLVAKEQLNYKPGDNELMLLGEIKFT